MTQQTSFIIDILSASAGMPLVAGVRPHLNTDLSNKLQLLRLCARIGFNPPRDALYF